MSEASEQASDIKQLADAVLSARAALAAAEKAATDYAAALAAGTAKIDRAKEVEIEAARAVAKAQADKAQAMLRAEADGTAATQRAAKAAADSAKAAVDAAKEIEGAERRKQAAQAESAAKLSKLKELAIGALGGEETVEKYNKAKQALTLAGDASMSTGQRMLAGASAAKFAAGAVGALAGGLADFASEARKASADLYLYDQRVRALGQAHEAAQRATAGAADTQALFALKQEIVVRGMQATDAQVATLARKMREFANETQSTQAQAAQVIQQALDGDERAATRLGVTFNNASTSSERFSQVLAALAAQQRGATVQSQNAAEAATVQSQASDRAAATAKKLLYQITGISIVEDIAVGAARGIDSMRVSIEGSLRSQQAQTTATNAQQQAAQNLATVENQRAATERAHAATALAAAQADLQRLGEQVAALGPVISAQEEYNRALTEAGNIARRTGENDTAYDQRRLDAANRLTAAIRRKNEEQARRDAEAQSQRELGALAAQIRAHGGVVDARIRSIGPAQLYRDLQREIAGFAQRENESTTEATQRLMQLMQQSESARQAMNQGAQQAQELAAARREERDLLTEAENLHAKIATVERRAGETALDYLRRRLEAQRELNQAAQQGHDEAREAFNEFQRQTAERVAEANRRDQEEQAKRTADELRRAEMERENELGKQRAVTEQNAAAAERERADEVDSRLRESFGLAQEQSATVNQSIANGAKAATDAVGELASGIARATAAAMASGEDVGAAVAKTVDDWAGAKALQWGLQAAEAFAGAGVAYFIRPDAVPGLIAAGAQYAGLAAIAGATAAVIPSAPAASSGGGGAGNSGLGMAASMRADSANAAAQPNMVINVAGFVTSENVQDALAAALRDAAQRGVPLPGM